MLVRVPLKDFCCLISLLINMKKLQLLAEILILLLRLNFVRTLECRYAVLKRYGHPTHLYKEESSITCEEDNQLCARLHIEGLIDSKNVSMHAASCLNSSICEDDEICPIGFLQDVSWDHPLARIESCETKCCSKDHCNKHKKNKIGFESRKLPKGPSLCCYSGIVDYSLTGVMITNTLRPKECLYSAHTHRNDRESSCLLIRAIVRDGKTKSPNKITYVSHCARTEMCSDQSLCRKSLPNDCNITCCSSPFCNDVNGETNVTLGDRTDMCHDLKLCSAKNCNGICRSSPVCNDANRVAIHWLPFLIAFFWTAWRAKRSCIVYSD